MQLSYGSTCEGNRNGWVSKGKGLKVLRPLYFVLGRITKLKVQSTKHIVTTDT